VYAAGVFDEAAIDAKVEFGHGLGFVNVRAGEQFGSEGAEDFLRGREKTAVLVAAAGNVEQAEEDALGADANGIVEISGNALAYEDGCNVRALDLGKGGWDRLDDGFIVGTSRVKKQSHGWRT
jgi:hypothetical protein